MNRILDGRTPLSKETMKRRRVSVGRTEESFKPLKASPKTDEPDPWDSLEGVEFTYEANNR